MLPPSSCGHLPHRWGDRQLRFGRNSQSRRRLARRRTTANLPTCGGDVRQDREGRERTRVSRTILTTPLPPVATRPRRGRRQRRGVAFLRRLQRQMHQHAEIGDHQDRIEGQIGRRASSRHGRRRPGRARSCVVSTPVTSQGWRPISVVYQPASVATQPDRAIGTMEQCQRPRQSRRRHRNHAPAQEMTSIRMPVPTMMRKPKKQRADRRMVADEVVEAGHDAVGMMRQDQAAGIGDGDFEAVFARGLVGPWQTGRAACWRRSPNWPPWRRSWAAGARACSGRAGRRRRSGSGSGWRRRRRRCAALSTSIPSDRRRGSAAPTGRR